MNVAADFINAELSNLNFCEFAVIDRIFIPRKTVQFASSKFISADMVKILIYFNAVFSHPLNNEDKKIPTHFARINFNLFSCV